MSNPGIETDSLLRYKEIVKKEKQIYDNHLALHLCPESRWPYTSRLKPQEIACMRDCYVGHRFKHTKLEQRSNYDRIHDVEQGWDQRAKYGDRQFLKPLQLSAKEEETNRSVVVSTNSTYGHRAHRMFDTMSGDRARICHTHNFPTRHGMAGLPPLDLKK